MKEKNNKKESVEKVEKKEQMEIVKHSNTSISYDDTQGLLEVLERRNELIEKVQKMALSATRQSNWQDFSGKPYLDGDGAAIIFRRFGVRVHDLKIERLDRKDDKGSYYIYKATGKATLSNIDSVESIGTCSSRDRFFGQKGGKYKNMSEVTEDHILKKAKANLYANLAKDLFGLRDISWEELELLTDGKIKKANSVKVEFAKGAQGGTKVKLMTKEQQREIMSLAEALQLDSKNNEEDKKKFWSYFQAQKTTWKNCTAVQAGKIIEAMRADLQALTNEMEEFDY